jgi:hypothetical protein
MVLRNGVLIAVGATAAGTLLPSQRALADNKASKESMMYQDKPHGDQQCDNCIQFIPGKSATANGTCKAVAGDISPKAWCVAYTRKA